MVRFALTDARASWQIRNVISRSNGVWCPRCANSSGPATVCRLLRFWLDIAAALGGIAIAGELAKQVRDHLDVLEGDPFAIGPAVAAMAALL